MKKLHDKECFVTLFAFIVVTLLTHIYPIYFLFPSITEMVVLGFPAHYLLAIVVSWLVLIPLYYIYILVSEKIDQDILEASEAALEAEEAQKAGAVRTAGGAR